MKSTQTFREISIDAGATWSGDYTRGYQVQVSADGTTWGSAVQTGKGTAQVVVVDFASQSARYVRVTLTSAATSTTHWWSIAEFNVLN
jgi:hypothetical protein